MAITRTSRARIVSSIVAMNAKVDAGLVAATTRINDTEAIDRQDGTGAAQANRAHSFTASLNNNTAVTYDLTGVGGGGLTTLTDSLGSALALSSLSALKFTNEATTGSGYFEVTLPAALGGGDVRIGPGMSMLVASGSGFEGVSPGQITVSNKNGATASFSLTVVGVGS